MFATRQEIRAAAGHLVICGFEGKSVGPELREIMREVNPLGLILFARNIESVEAVTELNRELKALRREPLLLTVDQEGGRVARVKQPATVWPPMRRVGDHGDPAVARRVGEALAKELRAMNFDVDYAPVLDVDTNPKNPIIGDRAFSRDPQVVAKLGAAFIEGLQGAGVGGCGKHFPGHGDTDLDSHLALPRVSHDLDRLREVEWPPFKAAIEAGLGAIMTAHVVVEALDTVPATLSPKILRGSLRRELKFDGLIISDDIDMKAVADAYSPEELAVQGLLAGVDLFLACRNPASIVALYRGIIRAVEDEIISHDALLEAAGRALKWRRRYFQPAVDPKLHAGVVGALAHGALVQEIDGRA
jgi:beta-N-acetylhexosaminidase